MSNNAKMKINEPARAKEVRALLYQKGMLEHNLAIYDKNAQTSDDYYNAMEKARELLIPGTMNRLAIEYEMIEVDRRRRDFIESFKRSLDIYQGWLPGILNKLVNEEEAKTIEYKNIEAEATALIKREIWGQVLTEGDDVELPKIITEIEAYLVCIENYIDAIQIHRKSDDLDVLEKAKLNYELCKLETHKITLTKRLNKRKDYYINQFLPRFEKDMARKTERFDMYLKNAREIASLGIDIGLAVMLAERETHKQDDEHEWLFFTALESRLHSIAKEMGRKKKKYLKYPHLTNPKIYEH